MPAATKTTPKNPDWTRDEHILALDLYLSAKPGQPQKGSKEVAALSALLNRLHRKLGTSGLATLRNADGVYMKLMNLKSHDPDSVALGRSGLQRGNRLEADVWREFGADPTRLKHVADAIRSFIESSAPLPDAGPDGDDELSPEGRVLARVHRSYERNPKNRAKKIARFQHENGGRVFCEACGFDFEHTYGDRGIGFIECHHVKPVSVLRAVTKPVLGDFRLVCSNCHRMIHRGPKWLEWGDLAALVATVRSLNGLKP
jgi:5-methylcytosine-specific restriction enzyme A